MVQKLHLKAPDNWINDPNGFIYFKGKYHLFYQHFPYEPRWGTMHWGHAVSMDLVNWEHKGIALFPTRYADQNGCFSGSAVEQDGCLYLYYTGVHYEEVNPDDIHQCLNDRFEASQLMISSKDGFQFDNLHGKRVIIPPIADEKIGDRTHTRDPKVWRGRDAWYMVLGSRTKEEGGELLFYRSDNLSDWSFVNRISKQNKMGWMWECPDYFETEGGKVLIFSPMGLMKDGKQYENQTVCMPVAFEEETCTMNIPDTYQFFDYGLDLYAPQSTVDDAGRRVLVAWARMPEAVDGRWCGMFCMPRVVEVKNGHIYFRLHPNIKQKFRKEIFSPGEADKAGYCISMELDEGAAIDVGGYKITHSNGRIHADRTAVFGGIDGYRMEFETPELKDGSHLDIYVDDNLIEVYVNDGEYVISNTVYGLGSKINADPGVKFEMYTIC